MIFRRAAPRCVATSRGAFVAVAARLSAFPLASGFGQPELTSRRTRPPARQELGSFRFTSKTHRCVAHVFVMRVTEVRARLPLPALAHATSLQELAVWPERHERQREWVRAPERPGRDARSDAPAPQCLVPDAIARCRHAWMQEALQQWVADNARA